MSQSLLAAGNCGESENRITFEKKVVRAMHSMRTKNWLRVRRITKEVITGERNNRGEVKYKNLEFEDQNGLIDQRVLYNNIVDYEKIVEGTTLPGRIVVLNQFKIVQFEGEKLYDSVLKQKHKYVGNDSGPFLKLLNSASEMDKLAEVK